MIIVLTIVLVMLLFKTVDSCFILFVYNGSHDVEPVTYLLVKLIIHALKNAYISYLMNNQYIDMSRPINIYV